MGAAVAASPEVFVLIRARRHLKELYPPPTHTLPLVCHAVRWFTHIQITMETCLLLYNKLIIWLRGEHNDVALIATFVTITQ